MRRNEWYKYTRHKTSNEEWELISVVIEFHSSLYYDGAIEDIVLLYKQGGMEYIKYLSGIVQTIIRYKNFISEAKEELHKLQKELVVKTLDIPQETARRIEKQKIIISDNQESLLITREYYHEITRTRQKSVI